MIKLSNVSLKLKDKLVLNNLNLIINNNDKVGIIGSNGSGKTVLLRLLAGIYNNYKGEIYRQNSFFFLSAPGLGAHPHLKLIDNLKRILAYYNISNINIDIINQLIIDFEFSKFQDYEFHTLSQGYKVRVSIIVFFLLNFKNVLIDEFIGFGDKFTLEKFYNKLSDKILNLETLVVASHNKSLINKFCNRIIEIEKGSIINDYRIS